MACCLGKVRQVAVAMPFCGVGQPPSIPTGSLVLLGRFIKVLGQGRLVVMRRGREKGRWPARADYTDIAYTN